MPSYASTLPLIFGPRRGARESTEGSWTWLWTSRSPSKHSEGYESMSSPPVRDIIFLAEVSNFLQIKILLLHCSATTGWVPNDPIHHLRAISPFERAHCEGCTRLALDDPRWINAIFLSFSSASFLSADPFKLSIPSLLSPPLFLSLFHEQEGFTLLLCHPNWLH